MAGIRIWYQSYVDEEHGRAYWDGLRAHLARVKDADTTIDIKGITPHNSYAHPLVEWRCAREMICNAILAERQGYDAFMIGHFQDAGLYEARAATGIPVLGLGETSMLHGCKLGQRLALISLKSGYEPWFRNQIAKYGLEKRVDSINQIHVPPELFAAAWTSEERAQELFDKVAEQVRPLVAAGAEVLLPSGGGPMVLLSRMKQVDGAPILDGTAVAIKIAEATVKLKRTIGLDVSRAGTFRQAPASVVEEFLTHPKGL